MKIVRFVVALALLAVGLGTVATPALAYPAGQLATASINSTVFAPGSTVVVTVGNTTPGPLTMLIFSAPVVIGTGTVGPNFQGSVSGTIPAGYSGQHTIQVNGAGGEIFNFAIKVVASPSGFTAVSITSGCQNPAVGAMDGFIGVDVTNQYATSQTYTVDVSPGVVSETFTLAPNEARGVNADDLADGSYQVTVTGAELSGDPTPVTIACAPPTSPPTMTPVPPSGTSTPSATATVTLGSGTGRNGGALASTGAQVGLGAGLGVAALVGGGALLLATRRRSTPRHGG